MASGTSDPTSSGSTERPGPFEELLMQLEEVDPEVAAYISNLMELGESFIMVICRPYGPDCSMYE